MLKRRVIFVVVLLALGAGLFGILSHKNQEPVYQGKPASYWLMRMRAPEVLPPVDELKLDTPGLKLDTGFGLKPSSHSSSGTSLPYQLPGPNSSALEAFRAMGDASVPVLLRNLRGDDSVMSQNAAIILSEIGPIDRDVLAELVEILRATESRQHQIYRVLSAVLPTTIRSKLSSMKVPQPFYNRYADPWYMQGMRAQGVIRAMTIRSQGTLRTNAHAMKPIFETIPLLNRALGDREDKVVYLAAGALQSIGPDAQRAVPMLVKQLMNTRRAGFAREQIVQGLRQIGIFDQKVVWALVSATQTPNQDRSLQCAAVAALGKGGGACKDAVPILKEMLKSEDAVLRSLAHESLRKIEPSSIAGVKEPDPIKPSAQMVRGNVTYTIANGTDDYSLYMTYHIKD
ncbi:MAG: repeat-containing protein [Pedosphaera sp.]|nr:repeat-containing protein [Pedosphaera sp.]